MISEEIIDRIANSSDTEWLREMALRYSKKYAEAEVKLKSVTHLYTEFLGKLVERATDVAYKREGGPTQDELEMIQALARKKKDVEDVANMPTEAYVSMKLDEIQSDPERWAEFMEFAKKEGLV